MTRFTKLMCVGFVVLTSAGLMAQSAGSPASRLAPELILYNAKIVTVDDPGFTSTPGTIVQALAVRGDTIFATGTTAEIRALAGPNTRQIDLKGRTVLPAFSMTHEHPTDWMFIDPEPIKYVQTTHPEINDVIVFQQLAPEPAAEQVKKFEPALKALLARAKPGQWVVLGFNWGPEYEYAADVSRAVEKITKAQLDALAPDNPVKIKDGFIGGLTNSKGIEIAKQTYADIGSMFVPGGEGPGGRNRFEATGRGPMRAIEPDLVFKGNTELLAEVLKAEMEMWVAQGVTTVGSSPYALHNFQALSLLDQRGDMPMRFAWGYTGPDFHEDTLRVVAGLLGHGSSHLWNVGAWQMTGGSCTTLNATPEVKAGENCNFAPGSPGRETLERIIRTGNRIGTLHTGGDLDIDYLMDAIEKASKQAGFTLAQIRAKRHAFDHGSGAPRPDQIPRIKNLGMMVSMINTMLWENHRDYDTSMRAAKYGLEYTHYAVPRNSTTKAGIMTGFEIDRPLPDKVFTMIHKGMTRYNDVTKTVYAPRERTDRIVQLKALTTWASYYVLREKTMGSIEAGKVADFIVLDRDYLTVPDDDIPKVTVLMTVVGGRVAHLLPKLATEIGLPPAGPITWSTKPFENYYSHANTVTQK